MKPNNFFAELRRRNVYKVAVAYAIVGWLLVQIATQVFPFFEIPNWTVRLVVLLLAIGFPVALILAWAFELTPEGVKRMDREGPAPSRHRSVASPPEKSIAVLPFTNLSRDPDNAFSLLVFRRKSSRSWRRS